MQATRIIVLAGLLAFNAGCAATGNMVGKIADVVPWGGEDEVVVQANTQVEVENTMASTSDVVVDETPQPTESVMAISETNQEPRPPYRPVADESHEHMGSKY